MRRLDGITESMDVNLIPTKYTHTHTHTQIHTHIFFPFLAMRLLTVNRSLPENDNKVKTQKAMKESSFSMSVHVCCPFTMSLCDSTDCSPPGPSAHGIL